MPRLQFHRAPLRVRKRNAVLGQLIDDPFGNLELDFLQMRLVVIRLAILLDESEWAGLCRASFPESHRRLQKRRGRLPVRLDDQRFNLANIAPDGVPPQRKGVSLHNRKPHFKLLPLRQRLDVVLGPVVRLRLFDRSAP